MASGGRHGLAQSLFQVGGNAGSAMGPLLAAFIVLPNGQRSIGWFSLTAILAMAVLANVGSWYKNHNLTKAKSGPVRFPGWLCRPAAGIPCSRRKVAACLAILAALIFSKFFYLVSLVSYYTFYLMSKFHLPTPEAQVYLSFSWARWRPAPSATASATGRTSLAFVYQVCAFLPAIELLAAFLPNLEPISHRADTKAKAPTASGLA